MTRKQRKNKIERLIPSFPEVSIRLKSPEIIREIAARDRLNEWEKQIEKMVYAPSLTVFTITRKLETQLRYPLTTTTTATTTAAATAAATATTNNKMNLVLILVKLRKRCPDKAAKIQRLIDHFASEHDNMLVLKP